jgi:Flp pilus assembly protein TadD
MLALADPSPPAAPLETNATPSLVEAGHAIERGRLEQARAMLGAAIAVGAKGDPVDRLLADLEFASGHDDRALAYYQGLLVAHPGEALLLERAGISAIRLGRLDEAVRLLDRATAAHDAGWRAWNARGVAADRQGRWDEAAAAYDRAEALGPGQAEVANNRGWSAMLRGDWAAAVSAFERAAAINPNLPRLANNLELARSAVAAGLPARRAGEGDDAYAARLNDAGVIAEAAGEAAKAKAAYTQALQLRSRWYALAADNLARVAKAP